MDLPFALTDHTALVNGGEVLNRLAEDLMLITDRKTSSTTVTSAAYSAGGRSRITDQMQPVNSGITRATGETIVVSPLTDRIVIASYPARLSAAYSFIGALAAAPVSTVSRLPMRQILHYNNVERHIHPKHDQKV